MKNKFIKIKLTSGKEIVMKKSRIRYVVYHRVDGQKVVGCLATKTKCVDGVMIANQQEIVEQLEDYFRSKK
ncbi:hypothetical protein [Fructilactobacillus frigidiflavus]|uniref:hypothetical protein n=1 Tax=Fructilactobacillus frigidiflavus TaxID=3242688 RepID=UPI003757FC78